jgi:putative DNA primase/helicase
MPPLGLAYRIKEKIVGDPGRSITAPYVAWDADHVKVTANEAMAADNGQGDQSACAEAEDFLHEVLADGPMAQKKVKVEAEGAGLSWRTVRRAKDRLGIKPYKERGKEHGGWLWSLSQGVQPSDQDAHVKKLDTLDTLDTFGASDSQDGQGGQDLEVGTLLISDGHLDEMPDLPAFLDRRSARA